MLEYLKNKKILVIAAHPDDELLGVGATINKLVNDYGCLAKSVILGEGITSRDDKRNKVKRQKDLVIHQQNFFKAQQVIGYTDYMAYDFPDNRFDSVDLLDLIKVVEDEREKVNPDVIFTHHGGDLNIDHQKTFEAVMTAFRPFTLEKNCQVYTFETPSATESQSFNYKNYFRPQVYFQISEANLDSKIKGMECYEFEKRSYPHPRSPQALEYLARKRGIEAGLPLAEAFELIRNIVRL